MAATKHLPAFRGTLILSGANAKTVKGDDEYVTAILYLAPADVAGGATVCPAAVAAGCKAACLYSAGRGRFTSVQAARIRKTKWFQADPAGFIDQLDRDLSRFENWCKRHGVKPAVRLNGTSDIEWERIAPQLFDRHPGVQFYDYTKLVARAYRQLPANYDLTLSYSGSRPGYAASVIAAMQETGINAAIVYRTRELAAMAADIDGDKDDMRFADRKGGLFVGLYAKGAAKADRSGFVQDDPVPGPSGRVTRLEAQGGAWLVTKTSPVSENRRFLAA